jgi:hypothetical protein
MRGNFDFDDASEDHSSTSSSRLLRDSASPAYSGQQKFAKSAGKQKIVDGDRYTCMQVALGFCTVAVISLSIALGVVAANSNNEVIAIELLSMSASQELSSTQGCSFSEVDLTADLERMRTRVRNEATRRGTVDWATYTADPDQHAGKRVEVVQTDFDSGTLRLRTSGVFVLTESVDFEPMAGNDHRPDRQVQAEYAGMAYVLDFFAAMAVEADDIVIDLNGHRLQQSEVHAVQQRFYANIELASQPFLGHQGPASFGAEPKFANGLVVENGVLGRSSHHGMHGNGGRRVLLQDLEIEEYEVAAIHLNGFKDTLIRRVHAKGQRVDVPVLGTYSNGRFILPFVDRVLASQDVTAPKKNALSTYRTELETLMQQVKQDVQTVGEIVELTHPAAHALFANPSGMTDGNSYSLAIHPNGVAVGPFWSQDPPESGSDGATERLLVRDSTFEETRAHIVEVVALVTDQNVTVRGPAGDVVRLIDNVNAVSVINGPIGNYVANALADVQLALIDASLDVADPVQRKMLFGTTNGDANVVAWWKGTRSAKQLVEDHGFKYWRNGDTMFHVNKGVLGVRIDGARDVCLYEVDVNQVRNSGPRGIVAALPGEPDDIAASYVGALDGGHPEQGRQYGYMGSDTRGLGISGSTSIHLQSVRIDGVHSSVGLARGIDIFNHAQGIHVGPLVSVNNVTTLVEDSDEIMVGNYANGPKVGAAIGVHCSGGSAPNTFGGNSIMVTEVHSGVFDQAHVATVSTEIEAVDVASVHPNTYEL